MENKNYFESIMYPPASVSGMSWNAHPIQTVYAVTATAMAGTANVWWLWEEQIAKFALPQSPNGGPRNAWKVDHVDGAAKSETYQDMYAASVGLQVAYITSQVNDTIWQAFTEPPPILPVDAPSPATADSPYEKSDKDWKLIESIPLSDMSQETVDSSLQVSTTPKAEKKKFLSGLLNKYGIG